MYDSNVQVSRKKKKRKNHEAYKERGKKEFKENVSEKHQMVGVVDKDFKTV